MRLSPALTGLILLALPLLGCGVPDPAAVEAPPPFLTPQPARTPGAARPGLPPLDASIAPGRLPQQPAAPTSEARLLASYTLDPALQKRIEAVLGDDAAHYGVYVKHLGTNRGAEVNAAAIFNAASLFKLEVMYEVFRQRALDVLKFDELLEVTEYYAGFDLGTLRVEVGQSMSVAEALYYMMTVSDNVSAVLLQDRAGAGNINGTMLALGLESSGLYPEFLPATAADFGVLLEAIVRSPELDGEAHLQMLELMLGETIDNGLASGLPDGTKVAHKTGNWFDATHDAAVVAAPGGVYVIVVLSDLGYQAVATRSLSEAVWEHFQGLRR